MKNKKGEEVDYQASLIHCESVSVTDASAADNSYKVNVTCIVSFVA